MTTINIRIISPAEQRAEIYADPLFVALVNANRAAIEAYLAANVVDIPSVNAFLSLLARSVVYLVNKDSA